ncbi:NEDD4 family-interacting protein 2 [Apodemus speciosus]|uniref:NEDD4 family-interacting protein 2 n=1 Tax=Apodemus speciosus TaxID=105296 RepID=A0ABQ0FIT6_APOSI
MDHHQLGTGRYQVLHNEEDNSESSAVEQASAPSSAAQTVDAAASAPALGPDSSPPPYSSLPVGAPTASDTDGYSEFYPVPPPYSVATSLPTYDEAEKAKAAALAAAAADAPPRNQEEECPPRDDFSDVDQLRVGNDGIFMLAFFMAFIFNWLGFCLSFCITNTIAGRYGAICGFGLSLIKWILIVRFSDYFTGYFNGQYWLWWIFLVLGLLLFFRGFVNYLKVRNMSEKCRRVVVAHAFNPSTWEAEAGGSLEFEASLVYRVSFRTAKATQKTLSQEEKLLECGIDPHSFLTPM